jgi:hypothetical protein
VTVGTWKSQAILLQTEQIFNYFPFFTMNSTWPVFIKESYGIPEELLFDKRAPL